jgi:hypothetical protein
MNEMDKLLLDLHHQMDEMWDVFIKMVKVDDSLNIQRFCLAREQSSIILSELAKISPDGFCRFPTERMNDIHAN